MLEGKRLLIVDDDPKITQLMQKFLQAYGLEIKIADCGEQMFTLLKAFTIDLIILDVMLPGDDGFEICRKLRQTDHQLPVIMLTAVGEDTDRILGLEIGADDYLTKPFNMHELIARIKALFRRDALKSSQLANTMKSRIVFHNWTLDKTHRTLISADGLDVSLTDGEYRLLEALVDKAGKVLSRDDLLALVENRQAGPFDRSIDVRISRLRQKLEADPKEPILIKTVRGGGYILTAKVEAHA